MGFDFDKLKGAVSDLAQTGVAKGKELADVALAKSKELGEMGKLKVSSATEQENIKKAYLELGRLYFAERGHAPEAAYADLCQRVQNAQDKIAYNNQRMADIRAAGKSAEEELFIDCDFSYVDDTLESDAADIAPVEEETSPTAEELPVEEKNTQDEIILTIEPSSDSGDTPT